MEKTTKRRNKMFLLGITAMMLSFVFMVASPLFAENPPPCSTCGGKGTLDCRTCGGDGRVVTNTRVCDYVGTRQGTGVGCRNGKLISGAYGTNLGRCPQCGGTGEISELAWCTRCGGDGEIDCPACNGSGYSWR